MLAELAGQEVDKLLAADVGIEEATAAAPPPEPASLFVARPGSKPAEPGPLRESATGVEQALSADANLSSDDIDALLSTAADDALTDPGAALTESVAVPPAAKAPSPPPPVAAKSTATADNELSQHTADDEQTLDALAKADVAAADTIAAPPDPATSAIDADRTAENLPDTAKELDALFAAINKSEIKGLVEAEVAPDATNAGDGATVAAEISETPTTPLPADSELPNPATASGGPQTPSAPHSPADHEPDSARAALFALDNQPAGPKVTLRTRLLSVLGWINAPFDALGDTPRALAGALGLGSLMICIPAIIWRVWFYKG